jgi:hypothetical protein
MSTWHHIPEDRNLQKVHYLQEIGGFEVGGIIHSGHNIVTILQVYVKHKTQRVMRKWFCSV